MGDGRVTDIRPKTLKRIHFYENYEERSYEEKKKLLDEDKLHNVVEQIHINATDGKGRDAGKLPEKFEIPSNNIHHSPIYFTKYGSKEVIPHKDGTLINKETGELLYFVVKKDVVGKKEFDDLDERSRVTFTDQKRGICEIILHKKDGDKSNDLNLESSPVIVEFVEIVRFDGNPDIITKEAQKLS